MFARRALRMTAGGAPAAAELDVRFGGVLLRGACEDPFDGAFFGMGRIGGYRTRVMMFTKGKTRGFVMRTYPCHVAAQREAAEQTRGTFLLIARHRDDRRITVVPRPGSSTGTAAVVIERLVGLERILVYMNSVRLEVNHVIAASAAYLHRKSGPSCPS